MTVRTRAVAMCACVAGIAAGVFGPELLATPDALRPKAAQIAVVSDVFGQTPPADLPAAQNFRGLHAASIRLLGVMPNQQGTLFAARDAAGNVCLIAVFSLSAIACTSPGAFAEEGLELQFDGTPTADGRAQPMTAEWLPDGRVVAGVSR